MDQYQAIYKVREMLQELILETQNTSVADRLVKVVRELNYFSHKGIDFKQVVDELSDSVFITDSDGKVLYVNPAYTANTGIAEEQVVDHNIHDLIEKDRLISGGAVLDVLKDRKPGFRLSETYADGIPKKGYVSGTPIFDREGKLIQVVAVSRPLVALRGLKEDFTTFLKELQEMNPQYFNTDSKEHLADEMIGKEGTLANVWTLINQVADSDATVLITGESGAGKEVIADEIYRHSSRAGKPYVKLNCAAIPAQLLESELFGYEKGAFSGANTRGKQGLFEAANHGTLLLDEIGDMPLDLQVKLLRAIQQQEITRIGGSHPIKLDIRFLALTNSNLKEKIAEGTFRQDLYYRLNVIPIHVPPLRERVPDIEPLCNRFIEIYAEKYNRPLELTEAQVRYLCRYQWPGNIRELENIIEYLVLCSNGLGRVDDAVLVNLLDISNEQSAPIPQETGMDFNDAVAQFEKNLLENVLSESSNLREAGEKLNISASTISRKINQYGIIYPKSKS